MKLFTQQLAWELKKLQNTQARGTFRQLHAIKFYMALQWLSTINFAPDSAEAITIKFQVDKH